MTALVGQVLGSLPASVRRLVPAELQADLRDRFGLWEPGDIGFQPDAPSVGLGERTGPPDFIVVGPAECGARWWMSLIADHPGVAPTPSVDGAAHLFDRYCTEGFGEGEIARFHAFFPRRPECIVGHWSADGLSYPWIAPLLARAAPGAKIIVMVRDPVERGAGPSGDDHRHPAHRRPGRTWPTPSTVATSEPNSNASTTWSRPTRSRWSSSSTAWPMPRVRWPGRAEFLGLGGSDRPDLFPPGRPPGRASQVRR